MNGRACWIGTRIAWMLLGAFVLRDSQALDWTRPWVPPQDPQQAERHSDEYAWRLFVALNWPADPHTRSAQRSGAFGTGPVIWETWQNAAEVYLDDGRDPGPWIAGGALPAIAAEGRFETFSLRDFQNIRHIVNGRMVPLTDPVASARRVTEIRMNQSAYDYIRARELYNVEGQLRAIDSRGGVHFPAGSIEVKAKWRPIQTDERARYYVVEVRLADGQERLYGLTALHIVAKDLPHWFWATFEHVDNPSLADSDGWQLPSSDRFACRQQRADCNRAPAGIGLEGTVWQHYRLRGTLTRFSDSQDRPQLLANSELEAGLQRSSSCITCHARAALGVAAGRAARLPIFETSDGTSSRGSIGAPRTQWYQNPDGVGAPLQQLDFVWSLAKARPRKGS